jgi:cell filamentation protein
LVLIHPFREGNGRCARLLALLMAMQAGLPTLDFWGFAGRGKRRYVAAIHCALDRDYPPPAGLFYGRNPADFWSFREVAALVVAL